MSFTLYILHDKEIIATMKAPTCVREMASAFTTTITTTITTAAATATGSPIPAANGLIGPWHLAGVALAAGVSLSLGALSETRAWLDRARTIKKERAEKEEAERAKAKALSDDGQKKLHICKSY